MFPAEIEVEDLSIDVHVAGPGFGEGICIVIGKKILVGIDCCACLVHSRNGWLSYLDSLYERLGSDSVCMWVISHFHYDHIHSLSVALGRVSERLSYVLAPTDYTEADLAFVIGLDAKDVKGNAAAFYLAKGEYERLRRMLLNNPAIVRAGFGMLSVASVRLVCGSENRQFTIDAFGPTISDTSLLVAKAVRSLAESEGFVGKSREMANAGSYVLRLQLDDFEGLFLGDAPARRVEELVANGWRAPGRPSFLKVSHHGSGDGTSEKLLKLMTGGRDACRAVIAPFVRYGLPKDSVVDLLRQFGFEVATCGKIETDSKNLSEIVEDYFGVAEISLSQVSPFGRDVIVTKFNIGAPR